ncbi:hypothetical protein QO004_004028 [Rhizobium mesoamericanum]|uniref:hypothetical protein n=1 Tax=Rhizobium mesoamericanum TaxID=1079800 RepID=UPI0027877669|nr:hypothetical protein [Rhizobium mesoamericanum]MDQ0562223.1 hypothetical protein [Rhizobium mesoamericanum]
MTRRSQRFDLLPGEKTAADMLVISEEFLGRRGARIRKAIDYQLTFRPTGQL